MAVALVVGLGGAAGALARYYATLWVRALVGGEAPWGTLAVNVVGSFLLGLLFVWLQSRAPGPYARELLLVGFLGSFTTFSTFSYEVVAMARAGAVGQAGAYAAGSVVLGIVAVLLGAGLATMLVAPDG